jgi:geranylgeranylglycerol-phosphate geranylgeranyltransferase
MENLAVLIKLSRWPNCMITALVILAVFQLLPEHPSLSTTAIAILAATLITAFGNIFNDLLDQKSDKINHPDRPLPAGLISSKLVILYMIIFTVAGLILAYTLNLTCFLFTTAAAVMLLLYSLLIKRIPLLSNIWIAFIGMLVFFYAGAVDPDFVIFELNYISAGGIFAFWLHLGREIIKDMQDREGDSSENIKTLANSCPLIVPRISVTISLLIMMIFGGFIYNFLKPGLLFIVLFILGIVVPVLMLLFVLWRRDSHKSYRLISMCLKVIMPIGLLVLLTTKL